MAKRDKVLSEEVAANVNETLTKPETQAPEETQGVDVSALPPEVQEMLKRYEERAQAAEADKEKSERKAVEAQERLKAQAQAMTTTQRPSSLITTAMLEDRAAYQQSYVEDARPKVRPDQIKKARAADIQGTMRTIVCERLAGTGRSEVQVTLPAEGRLATGYDAYVVEFEGAYARVPQVIAEALCSQQPHRYTLAS